MQNPETEEPEDSMHEEEHMEVLQKPAQDIPRQKEACLVAVAGIKAGIGVTLHCVAFAKALQAAGHRTIIVEASGTQELIDSGINGIPIHPDASMKSLDSIAFDYDVIILDLGTYETDVETYFNRMDKKIIIAGAAPWELDRISKIFSPAAEEYLFVFNHVTDNKQESIRRNMHPLKVIFSPQLEVDAAPDEEMMHLLFPEYIFSKKIEDLPVKKGRRRKKDAGI